MKKQENNIYGPGERGYFDKEGVGQTISEHLQQAMERPEREPGPMTFMLDELKELSSQLYQNNKFLLEFIEGMFGLGVPERTIGTEKTPSSSYKDQLEKIAMEYRDEIYQQSEIIEVIKSQF